MTVKELEGLLEQRSTEIMEALKRLAELVGEARADHAQHIGTPDAHNPGMMRSKTKDKGKEKK